MQLAADAQYNVESNGVVRSHTMVKLTTVAETNLLLRSPLSVPVPNATPPVGTNAVAFREPR